MAPRSKKRKAKQGENGMHEKMKVTESEQGIPADIFQHQILPQLSFKSLSLLRCVSKEWDQFLSPQNRFFSREQSINPSSSSTAFIYSDKIKGLQFFPKSSEIGVPDPHLKFLPESNFPKLISSSNGLVLFQQTQLYEAYLERTYHRDTYYICNPATKKMHTLFRDNSCLLYTPCMGLFFDPSKSPDQFMLVEPKPIYNMQSRYKFEIFNSKTGKWTCSNQEISSKRIGNYNSYQSVTAHGIIYWNCVQQLLWFDPERERAGMLPLPYDGLPLANDVLPSVTIGAFKDEIYCTCKRIEGIEIWCLQGEEWEIRHVLNWDRIIHASFQSFDKKKNKNKRMKANETEANWEKFKYTRVATFDNTSLYLTVKMNSRSKKQQLLCFDLETEVVYEVCEIVIEKFAQILFYHNSMVELPEVVSCDNELQNEEEDSNL